MKVVITFLSSMILPAICLAQAPRIESVWPSQNDLNVPLGTNISVVFDTDMDETTLNDSTFLVFAGFTGKLTGQVIYNDQTRSVTFDPSEDFSVGEGVTAVLTTDIESDDGIPLEKSFAWSFTAIVRGGTREFVFVGELDSGSDPSSLVLADCDADGDNDLVCSNYGSNDIFVFMNEGEGSFRLDSTIVVGANPSMAIAVELGGGSGIDLVTTNAGTHDISILRNDGFGQFVPGGMYPVGNHPVGLFGADFNGDGAIDLATVNYGGGNVSVLLNDGAGTFFSGYSEYSLGEQPRWLNGGDIDNDGDFDLIATVYLQNALQILANGGDGSFVTGSAYQVADPISVKLADLNTDHYLDLAATNYQANNVSVLFNDQSGGYGWPSYYAVNTHPWGIDAADLDGDGDVDLYAGGYGSNTSLLINEGDGSFGPFLTQIYSRSICSGDIDGDGDLDLVTANSFAEKIYILENTGTTFAEVESIVLPEHARLEQNFPNPFNSSTNISFYLPYSGHVTVNVYDIRGRRVRNLLNCALGGGEHTVLWDGTNQAGEASASGIYFYSLTFNNISLVNRLTLLE